MSYKYNKESCKCHIANNNISSYINYKYNIIYWQQSYHHMTHRNNQFSRTQLLYFKCSYNKNNSQLWLFKTIIIKILYYIFRRLIIIYSKLKLLILLYIIII